MKVMGKSNVVWRLAVVSTAAYGEVKRCLAPGRCLYGRLWGSQTLSGVWPLSLRPPMGKSNVVWRLAVVSTAAYGEVKRCLASGRCLYGCLWGIKRCLASGRCLYDCLWGSRTLSCVWPMSLLLPSARGPRTNRRPHSARGRQTR